MNKYNKSTKRFIRNEKAKIRKENPDLKKQGELIDKLYKKVSPENEDK